MSAPARVPCRRSVDLFFFLPRKLANRWRPACDLLRKINKNCEPIITGRFMQAFVPTLPIPSLSYNLTIAAIALTQMPFYNHNQQLQKRSSG